MMKPPEYSADEIRKNQKKFWFVMLSFFIVYFFMFCCAPLTDIKDGLTVVFWPATGLAIGVFIVFGMQFWPAFMVGAALADFFLHGSVVSALAVGCGVASCELLGAWFIRYLLRQSEALGIHTESLSILAGSFLATLLCSTVGAAILLILSRITSENYWNTVFFWWSRDFLGALIITPVVLAFFSGLKFKRTDLGPWLIIATLGIGLAYGSITQKQNFYYIVLIFPYLLLCANLLGANIKLISASICLIGAFGLSAGWGQLAFGSYNQTTNMQLIIFSIGFSALMLGDFIKAGSLRFPAVIILTGWLISGGLYYYMNLLADQKTEVGFAAVTDTVGPRMQNQAHDYFSLLRAGAGLFYASKSVEREEWKLFVKEMGIKKNHPGLMGMGVVYPVLKKELGKFIQKTRLDDGRDFNYHTVPEGNIDPDLRYVTTFIEPYENNKEAMGLDMGSEILRRTAADTARDTGEPVISEKLIQLVTDPAHRPAFLIFYPIYTKGEYPKTIEERRARHLCWIYAPVIVEEFFSAVLSGEDFRELKYVILSNFTQKRIAGSLDYDQGHVYLEKQEQISIANRKFLIEMRPTEYFNYHLDNNSIWAAVVASLISFLITGLMVSLRSLRDRAQLLADQKTKELREEQLKFQNLLDGLNLGALVVLTDFEGKITYVNDKVCEASGYRREELFGSNPRMFSSGVHSAKFFKQMWNTIKSGKIWHGEICNRKKDGSLYWLDSSIVPLKMPDGQYQFMAIRFDVTERKNAEARMLNSSKMASLGVMAAGIAHEINNPLAIIDGKARQIQRSLSRAEFDRSVAESDLIKIQKTVERIAVIVKGLRSYSRDGKNDPFSAANIKDIINETLGLCRERFKNNDVEIQLMNILDLSIECRATEISQVLLNLLNNAFDAIESLPEKWVQIETNLKGSEFVQIIITDCGFGIPPEVAAKLMEPFYTTKDPSRGTGLGLSISQGIIQNHGGSLTLDQNSRNTRFVLELRVHQEKNMST